MSKKSKKKPQAATSVAAAVNAIAIAIEPDALPEPPFRLAEMQASARAHVDNKERAALLALARVPLTVIYEEDRKAAKVWQLRATTLGLYPPGMRSPYERSKDEHVEELVRSLRFELPGYDQARGPLEVLSCVRA